jgi:HEAT repeat protein
MTGLVAGVAGSSPKDRVTAVVRLVGEATLVRVCIEVLRTGEPPDDQDAAVALGGVHAQHELNRNRLAQHPQDYWWSVWALRVMLYAWDDSAEPSVTRAFEHEAWRVREMTAKVVAKREVGMAADAVAAAIGDPVPRVRVAALRAIAIVGEHEHLDAVRDALDDSEPSVIVRAEQALDRLARRLDL